MNEGASRYTPKERRWLVEEDELLGMAGPGFVVAVPFDGECLLKWPLGEHGAANSCAWAWFPPVRRVVDRDALSESSEVDGAVEFSRAVIHSRRQYAAHGGKVKMPYDASYLFKEEDVNREFPHLEWVAWVVGPLENRPARCKPIRMPGVAGGVHLSVVRRIQGRAGLHRQDSV